jgi:hypothetical protein
MKNWSVADCIDDTKAVAKYLLSLAFAPLLDAVYPPLDSFYALRNVGRSDYISQNPQRVPVTDDAGAGGEAVSPTPTGPASPRSDYIAAIDGVLKDHRFLATVGQCSCPCDSRDTPPRFTHSTWREHVAPLIAAATFQAIEAANDAPVVEKGDSNDENR